MADKPWKATERAVAARLGGHRVPITGRQRGDVPDVAHEWLSIEAKERKALPAWLKDAVRQAVAASTPAMLPVVVLHELGARHKDDLVLMALDDFECWFGPCGEVH
ncbi:MAG: hypothetical protein M1370_01970 [Bacteroidetes bacterium]|nr:hypothetical protein [Bacteroidota bacterium]